MCWKFRFQIMRVCRRPDKIIYIYIYSAACLRIDIQDLFWTVSQVAVDLGTTVRPRKRLKLRRANRWLLIIYWLVVYLPLWKIWKSVGMMTFNIWKNKTCSKPPTSLCTILRPHKNDTISVEPSILFVFLLLTPPKSGKPGWTDEGRLWFLIYIPCSQNDHF